MTGTNIGTLRNASGFMRAIAGLVLVTFTSVTLSPSVQAMQQYATQRHVQRQIAADDSENVGSQLARAKDQLRLLAGKPLPVTGERPTPEQRRAAKDALRAWRADYRALRERVQEEFDATGQLLERKKLPEIIKQRHGQAVAKFQSESDALESDIDAALSAPDEATVQARAQAAFERLDKAQLQRSQQEFDPNNLPNSSLKADPNRKPKLTPEEFQAALLVADPAVRLAQASGFDFSQLPGASDPTYLAATTEVVLTPDIQAKAEELHRNPVEIYNWVRNNVHWQPTWGAIQDASHTLSSQRGNAFDIASLTIALLRASGIPARYVHGTIEVPEDKFRNWAGGFQHIEAAMDFASAGGIPLTAVTSAGRIAKIRMEHIWVEAAVDFHPSRGVKNLVADSWVGMDPSFKQVEVLAGLDVVKISGINQEQLTQSYLASGTVNEAEGWVSGLDPEIFRNTQAQGRESLQDYINRNVPAATVGDIVGGRRIIAQSVPLLAASLPNWIVADGARYTSVPASLQQQITFAFGKDPEGGLINPHTFPWIELNNRRVILSFRSATQADDDALRALLPEGGISDISQLPTSIPAYLIRVIPELKVEEALVMQGSAMTLGADLTFAFNPKFVSAAVKPFSYKLPVGSYLAVAVVGGSLNAIKLAASRDELAATREILASRDPLQVSSITRDKLLGDMFHTGLLGYYEQYVTLGHLSGLKQGGHVQLAAGVGSYGYEPKVEFLFGIPRRLQPGGVVMNIPIVNTVTVDAALGAGTREFTVQLGALSSILEHAVPEQMFKPGGSGEAISALKALAMARAAGQRTYEITRQNQSVTLTLIHHDPATMDEIRSALAVGKVVITHTSAVTIPGWTGAGYVVMDPETGSAAWKIGGGQNGGFAAGALLGTSLFLGIALIAIAAFATGPVGLLLGGVFLGTLVAVISVWLAVGRLMHPAADPESTECFLLGFSWMFAILGAAFGIAEVPGILARTLSLLGLGDAILTGVLGDGTFDACYLDHV